MVPFSKTGGLADVAGALAKALGGLGHEVWAVVPFYKVTREKFEVEDIDCTLSVPLSDREEFGEVFKTTLAENVNIFFIKKQGYYDRDQLYGTPKGDYPDNAERFTFFSKAVLELCNVLDFQPDVIHCNDWQTGLVPIYLNSLFRNEPNFRKTASLFTIHNIGYQGLFWHLDMHLTNLPWDLFNPEGIEYYGKINFLKAGIIGADIINTVSTRYAKEIQTEEFGCGMEGILRKRDDRLYGVLNGVDYEEWNPATDKFLAANFDPANLEGKNTCKRDLLEQFNLPITNDTPLLGVISRLADQKGFDILTPAIGQIVQQGFQLVLLGTGEERYHKRFSKIAKKYPKQVGVKLAFSNELAHKIEAGADIFLMPSKYEPCGLNQMYSLKYGTVPLVRATGGLDDTIVDYPENQSSSGNGFKFEDYTSEALVEKLKQAHSFYKKKEEWKRIMENGMACDFSWDASAKKYVDLYQKAVSYQRG